MHVCVQNCACMLAYVDAFVLVFMLLSACTLEGCFIQTQKFYSIYQHKVDRQLSGYIQKFERVVNCGWQSLDMAGEDPVDVVLANQVDLVDIVKLGRFTL